MSSLFSRLQKLNKDGRTCQLCGGPVTVYTASEGTSSYESVPPNSLPAVLNLIEAAQRVQEMRRTHKALYGYEKQEYIIDNNDAWRALEAAVALFASGKEEP